MLPRSTKRSGRRRSKENQYLERIDRRCCGRIGDIMISSSGMRGYYKFTDLDLRLNEAIGIHRFGLVLSFAF